MPMDPADYPRDWKQVSFRVKVRAGFRCEWEDPHSGERCGAVLGNPHPGSGKIVKLAAAHICTCKPRCGNEDHLLALCDPHHLLIDLPEHVRAWGETRRKRKIDAGQESFEGLLE